MGSGAYFTARVESRNGVARVALTGDLDIAAVPVLEDHLARFEGNGVRAVMLDLRDLAFLDSSGLQALLSARRRAEGNGHRVILIGASPAARRLFELTGTQFLLDEGETVLLLEQFTGGEGRRDALTTPGEGA